MRKLNGGTILGFIALFVALSSGAYAAISLPKNSVTTKQVKDHSLMKRDFKRGQIPAGQDGLDGLDGAAGPAGPAGAVGPAGATGVANIVITQASTTLCSGSVDCSVDTVTAICPVGTKPLGGGVVTSALNGTFVGTITTNNGYAVGGDNFGSSSTADLNALAYCSTDVKSVTFPNGATLRPMSGDAMDALVARKLAAH
jgi:hypothetical protein